MVKELNKAGLQTGQQVAELLDITPAKLRSMMSLGLIYPRPQKLGLNYLWTTDDVERARNALTELNRKRVEAKVA